MNASMSEEPDALAVVNQLRDLAADPLNRRAIVQDQGCLPGLILFLDHPNPPVVHSALLVSIVSFLRLSLFRYAFFAIEDLLKFEIFEILSDHSQTVEMCISIFILNASLKNILHRLRCSNLLKDFKLAP